VMVHMWRCTMIALLSSNDSVALTAADRIDDTENFKAVNVVNLGPANCIVYEIQYTLRYGDAQYTREGIGGLVPGKPHLMSPGDEYRVLDKKVYESLREASQHDWRTEGFGVLTLQVRYIPGKDRVMRMDLMIEATDDGVRMQVMPADRGLLASLPREA